MKKLYITVLTLTILLACYLLYDKLAYLNIVIKFDNLEPIDKQMSVYYKGFKIGKTIKIYPDKDYQNTFIKLKLSPHDINLPDNITAKIKKNTLNNYINIEYPDSPSLSRIKSGNVIKGKSSKDINSAINDKLSDGGIDKIVDDATNLMESSNIAVQNLGAIFAETEGIIKDIRKDILAASSNLAKTTANLENISANLNYALEKEPVKNSVINIEKTTESIKEITQDLNNISTQIDKTTIPIVNSVLCETNSTVKNIKEITGGIKNTLKKHFGLGRIMFGKPINENCSSQN